MSDATPMAGSFIDVHAAVRNRGHGPATPTTLRYYQSTGSTISTSDRQLATEAVEALSASATESRTLSLFVSAAATFWVGACIDAVPDESDTDNNCSDGVRVVVDDESDEDPEGAPDLIVSGFSVNNANPAAEEDVTLHATVRNRGDGPAPTATIRYYRSSDATIGKGDSELGFTDVAPLAPGASESTTRVFALAPGTFWVGVRVDSVLGESDRSNNCSDGVQVVVEEPESGPDLVVPSVTVSDANPAPNTSFDISATVENVGDAPSSPTTLRFYVSTDSTITTSDTLLSIAAVAALAPGATASRTLSTSRTTSITFWAGACINSVSGETDTNNNCSDGVQVVVE